MPLKAMRARICLYGSGLLDTNGIVTNAAALADLVDATNTLQRIPPDQIGARSCDPGTLLFVTFADAAHSMNVLGEYGCAFVTNGRLTMRTSRAWIDRVSTVASELVAPRVIPLPTEPGHSVALEGQIHGRLDSDGACVWLDVSPSGRRVGVIWPLGYSARRRPLRVLDSAGSLVGRVGDEIDLASGSLVITSGSRVRLSSSSFDFVEPPSTRSCISLKHDIWAM